MSDTRTLRRLTVSCFVALGAAALVWGCGGGGGSTSPTSPGSPTTGGALGASFVASSNGMSNSLAWRSSSQSTPDNLQVDLVATQVRDLYGVSFDLVFPSNLVRYEEIVEHPSFAGDAGTQTSLLASQASGGVVVVGLSRIGESPGFSGTGVLMTASFTPLTSGLGVLAFENQLASDSAGIPQDLIAWFGGTVRVE